MAKSFMEFAMSKRLAKPGVGSVGARAVGLAGKLLGLDKDGLPKDSVAPADSTGWIAPLILSTAVGFLVVALAHVAGMNNFLNGASVAYWVGIILILFPISFRVASANSRRSERLILITILGLAVYGLKVLHSPVRFTSFDEHLHWVSALNLSEQHRLFGSNTLLPISPFYPGLEIVTNALSGASGLSIFSSGLIVVGLGKAVLLATLFLITETITRSSRVAGLACVLIMTSSTFPWFKSQFAYESLALVLSMLALLAAIRILEDGSDPLRYTLIGGLLAASVTVTHHLTSYFLTSMLIGFAALELLRGGRNRNAYFLMALAAVALTADLAWGQITGGTKSYLGPALQDSAQDALSLFNSGGARSPLVSTDGEKKPLWENLVGMASVLLVCAGLATGFFRSLNLAGGRLILSGLSLKLRWNNSGLVLLTLLTLGFPLTVVLRLAPGAGWEVGFRLVSYVYIGVCVVVAIAVAGLMRDTRPAIVAGLLTVMVLGGIITGVGPNFINYPYKAAADAQSIEPLGIKASEWTKSWLGRGQLFAADRVNQLLLAAYGRQIPITAEIDRISNLLFSKTIDPGDVRSGWVDYIMIDLRLTTGLPRYGAYIDPAEAPLVHALPPQPAAFLKFDLFKGVSRPFDNGSIIIYDLRPLHLVNSAANIIDY